MVVSPQVAQEANNNATLVCPTGLNRRSDAKRQFSKIVQPDTPARKSPDAGATETWGQN
jgi:hypothetical protein